MRVRQKGACLQVLTRKSGGQPGFGAHGMTIGSKNWLKLAAKLPMNILI